MIPKKIIYILSNIAKQMTSLASEHRSEITYYKKLTDQYTTVSVLISLTNYYFQTYIYYKILISQKNTSPYYMTKYFLVHYENTNFKNLSKYH